MDQELLSLGLSWNEVKVYKSLMKLGETPVGGVVNDLKIHRQIAYNALDALEKRGMIVKTMRNQVAHFQIQDPEIIVENVKKEEMVAKRLAEKIRTEMKKGNVEHQINIYNGQEGARRFYVQSFKKCSVGATVYVLGSTIKGHEEALGKDFIKGPYTKIKNKNKVLSRLLIGESLREENLEFEKIANPALRETRYLPYENLNPISTTVWENSVSFMSVGPEIFVIEIINKNFRNSNKEHFEMLWKIAKE